MKLAINSILIVISTSIIGTIMHELAHYVVGSYYDLNPELHHNYVRYLRNGTEIQKVLAAGAGPLFSLVFGIIILYISIKYIKPSLNKLFLTWLGMGNILVFLGYLFIAPIAKEGDTGRVFAYLGIPTWVAILVAIMSFLIIIYVFGKCSSQFVYYKSDFVFDKIQTQKQLFTYPILSSIIVMTLLSFPITSWVSLLPTLFMPMSYFRTLKQYKRMNNIVPTLTINKVSPLLLIVTMVSIMIFRYLV